MFAGPYIAIFVTVAFVAFIAMCVLLDLDRRYRREAEWVRDWEYRADRAMRSRLRLDEVIDQAGFMGEGLATMREHDLELERFCTARAEECRANIPKWLWRHYLVA